MRKFITAQVIKKDTFLFAEAPQTIALPCEDARLIDIGWAKPLVHNSVVVDYQKILIAPAKPSVDSIRIIIIEVGGSQYWVIAPDNATNTTFTNQCNACCGSTPSMPAVTIFSGTANMPVPGCGRYKPHFCMAYAIQSKCAAYSVHWNI